MKKSAPDLQKIIDDLGNMGKELDNIHNRMTKHVAFRVSALQKIADLMGSDGANTASKDSKKTKGVVTKKRKKSPINVESNRKHKR